MTYTQIYRKEVYLRKQKYLNKRESPHGKRKCVYERKIHVRPSKYENEREQGNESKTLKSGSGQKLQWMIRRFEEERI